METKRNDGRGDEPRSQADFPKGRTDHSDADGQSDPRHSGPTFPPEISSETRTTESSTAGRENSNEPTPGRTRAKRPKVKAQKAHSLIDKVYNEKNLYIAWRRVRANKGAHGLDRVTIRRFEADADKHLREIQRKLKERRYVPQPVRRVYIPKTSDPKKMRPLGIPVVSDRIVQQAIVQIVDPLFDATMSPRSYGFRKGRNAHQAIATLIADARDGHTAVVDADLASFFDKIDRGVIMSRVRARIADGRVLDLIEAFLKAGVHEDGEVTVPEAGTPQGGVISPWLANLVLDDLDKALEAKGLRHVRYADDFVVLCKTHDEAKDALEFVKAVVKELKLELNESKTKISDFNAGFVFLGFHFRRFHVGIDGRSVERFKDKVRKYTARQQGRKVEAILKDLNPVIRGWVRYVGVAEATYLLTGLDSWVRMRMRSFRYKRKCRNHNWRLPNRRLKKWGLLSLLECRPALRITYARGNTR